MKIGVIGAGKRFTNVYREILESLGCKVYIWNRTKEKIETLLDLEFYISVENIQDFENLDLDACLSFLPPTVSFDVLGSLDLDYPLLLETPIEDQRWLSKKNVGVLEQWVHLPVEKFKEEIYNNHLIDRPYWVYNDGRSFEYHAIAQLRKYCHGAKPAILKGTVQNIENVKGYIDKTGKHNTDPFHWVHGHVNLTNGAVLSHSFTYGCKLTEMIPIQMLRAYSANGTIVSGRINEMDNDYEMFEVRYCDNNRNVITEKVLRETDLSGDVTISLSIPGAKIQWNNAYADLQFNDQQTAIACVIEEATIGNLYTAEDSFLDNITMMGIKQSANQQNVLTLN